MRLITLNGVKLLVYRNGMILRYSDKQKGNHLIKGWQDCKGSFRLGYNVVGLNQKYFYRHRIIAYAFLGLDINNLKKSIDHIDRNKLNNNLNNLRIVSHQENMFNTNAKGYSFESDRNKFVAHICINHKDIKLGRFNTKEEARNAYLKAKERYHVIPSTLN